MNKDAKIIITGCKGQLGYDLIRVLNEQNFTNVMGIDRDELDITDEKAVEAFFDKEKPKVLFHCAAWTAVDKAEQFPDDVYKVNTLGTTYLAKAMKKLNGKMVYISTDYVFEGKGENYQEVNDPKIGISVYGKTKSKGEDAVIENVTKHFVVRISWLFGVNGNNFVKTMINLSDMKKESLSVVCDQIGSPTYSLDLARLLVEMIKTEKYGTYHATNEGVCSWYDFTKYIFEVIGDKDIKVNPVTTLDYLKINPNQANRPLNSRLSKECLTRNGFNHLPTWQDAVTRYIKEELKR